MSRYGKRLWAESVPQSRHDELYFLPWTVRQISCTELGRIVDFYLFPFAAFHLAQRARWAAAIRLRAATDMVLRPLAPV